MLLASGLHSSKSASDIRADRETLMRLAEGNHAVDAEVHGPIVMPVDGDGKPVLDVEAAEAKGKTVYWPTVRAHPQPQRVTCLCGSGDSYLCCCR